MAVSEEEYEIGLVSIAVPVRWIDGPGTGAINVSLPAGARHRRSSATELTARAADGRRARSTGR